MARLATAAWFLVCLTAAFTGGCGRDGTHNKRHDEPAPAPLLARDAGPAARSAGLRPPNKPVLPLNKTTSHTAQKVSSHDTGGFVRHGKRIYAIRLGARTDPAKVIVVEGPAWKPVVVAKVEAPATIVPVGNKVFVVSTTGLYRMATGKTATRLHEGKMVAATASGTMLYWASCHHKNCSVGKTAIASGKSAPLSGERLHAVKDIAVWNKTVWVAGRFRDANEGLTPTPAERDALARWIMTGGGAKLPRGARYPPGYLARIDDKGTVSYQRFRTQRPVELERDRDSLLVLTEGTPAKMFADGMLVRIGKTGTWTVLATGLAMPDSLAVGPERVCWTAMPGSRHEVQCWDRKTQRARVVVSRAWNILGFVDDGKTLTFSVLTKGVFRTPLP